jgi:hypothetical protein
VNRAKQNFPLLLLRIESTDVVNTAFLSWVRKNRWLLASICDHVNTAEFLRRGPAARRGSTSDNLYSFSVGNSLSRYRSKRLKTGKYSACRLEQRLESRSATPVLCEQFVAHAPCGMEIQEPLALKVN